MMCRPGGLMAEEQTPRELLSQLVERLDHLERVLQAQTARLYAVEQRLGLEPPTPAQRRPLYESLTDEREEARGFVTPSEPRAAREGVDEVGREARHAARQIAGGVGAGSEHAAVEAGRREAREGK